MNPTPMEPPTPEQVADALWQALYVQAQAIAVADDPRNAAASADACLKLAQTITVLDQSVISPQGVPPEVLAASVPQPDPAQDQSKKDAK